MAWPAMALHKPRQAFGLTGAGIRSQPPRAVAVTVVATVAATAARWNRPIAFSH